MHGDLAEMEALEVFARPAHSAMRLIENKNV
jgi:hypothetical protein